jgi:hypothetical protein
MRTKTLGVFTLLLASFACGMMGGGLESEECKAYFAKVEECAGKADEMKADILRKTAEESKKQFEKNANPMAVSKSCEMMLDSLKNDPACK